MSSPPQTPALSPQPSYPDPDLDHNHNHDHGHDNLDHLDHLDHSPPPNPPPKMPSPIPFVPPPWHLKGDVYLFSFWTSAAQAANLPAHTYSPLEAASSFADAATSRPVGGLSMVQIIRYRDSPVGPYDEMLLVPGSFDWSRTDENGRVVKGRNPKITRIYVSQKHTCYNGRLNWNVPKHLARFDWTEDATTRTTTIKIYPHDTSTPAASSSLSTSSASSTASESTPSKTPFFQASFRPVRYAPSFPLATRWASYIGFTTTLAMPPLPAGRGSQGELPGTDRWRSVIPLQYSSRTALGWFDIAQKPTGLEEDGEGQRQTSEFENFWPGLGRWQLGVKMQDADLSFGDPEETWQPTKANL